MADGHWLVGAAVGLLASRRDHHHCRQCGYGVGALLVWKALSSVLTDVLCS